MNKKVLLNLKEKKLVHLSPGVYMLKSGVALPLVRGHGAEKC